MKQVLLPAVVLFGLTCSVQAHDNPQTRPIEHARQARCIVQGTEVHKVYKSMLTYLERDLKEWDKLLLWVNEKMPLIAPSIEVHRRQSQINHDDLVGVPICPVESY